MKPNFPSRQTLDAYWLKLGMFVEAFAMTETQLVLTLYHIAGLDEKVAPILLSGVKTDLASNMIRKLILSREDKIPADLDDALNQLGEIASARNLILHHGLDWSELLFGGGATQARNWRSPTKGKNEQRSDPETLANMTTDLTKIGHVLQAYDKTPIKLPEKAKVANTNLRARPWQYKPEQQSKNRHKRQRTPQAQQRPPQPFEE